jgi:hypothetical protein
VLQSLDSQIVMEESKPGEDKFMCHLNEEQSQKIIVDLQ